MAIVIAAVVACKSTDPVEPLLAKFVDELVPADHERELRVRGTIAGPFVARRDRNEQLTLFTLVHNGRRLRVLATEILPITFREGYDGAADGRWLDAGEARPILVARGITDETEIFDARDVWVKLPDFTLGSDKH